MSIKSWLASSLVQVFPNTKAPISNPTLNLFGALNERMSFQVGVHAEGKSEKVIIELDVPNGWIARIRRVGYVPLWHRNGINNPEGDGHLPGLTPDPLFEESATLVDSGETKAFYMTVKPGALARPGIHQLKIKVFSDNLKPVIYEVPVQLFDIRIAPRRNFLVSNWFFPDALMEWYGCKGYDEKFWGLLPAYFKNIAEHGQNFISTPLLNWFGKRCPTQLLRVTREGKKYRFDFSQVKRWIDLAKDAGISNFEFMDLFTQWNASYVTEVYEDNPEDQRLLWQTKPNPNTMQYKKYFNQIGEILTPDATGFESRDFFFQLLPVLENFLTEENLHENTWFHFADEPERENIENYRKTRAMMRELAPWMKITDPFCWIEYMDPELIDFPFPRTALIPEIEADIQDIAVYYCGNPGPKSINRLMDTPLAQVRMNGWVFYRFGIKGFLFWSYNFWNRIECGNFVPSNPFSNFDTFEWPHHAYGDCWSVYPGPDAPIDTLRWEAFGDSLQDYALLQTLDINREDKLLCDIKGFEDFPISETWIQKTRQLCMNSAVHASFFG